jgi:hypothetical protein
MLGEEAVSWVNELVSNMGFSPAELLEELMIAEPGCEPSEGLARDSLLAEALLVIVDLLGDGTDIDPAAGARVAGPLLLKAVKANKRAKNSPFSKNKDLSRKLCYWTSPKVALPKTEAELNAVQNLWTGRVAEVLDLLT